MSAKADNQQQVDDVFRDVIELLAPRIGVLPPPIIAAAVQHVLAYALAGAPDGLRQQMTESVVAALRHNVEAYAGMVEEDLLRLMHGGHGTLQ